MEKVVLKVNVKTTQCGCEFVSTANGKELGRVCKDDVITGRFGGVCEFGECFCRYNLTYIDALEFVSDMIERTLGGFGIGVEFVNVDGEK